MNAGQNVLASTMGFSLLGTAKIRREVKKNNRLLYQCRSQRHVKRSVPSPP
jgi:hypothetical protein